VFITIFYFYIFFNIFVDLFEEAKNAEKDAQFVSSDEVQINALQNKKNIPIKRERKPRIYDSFDDIESTPSMFLHFKSKLNYYTFLNLFLFFNNTNSTFCS